MLLPRERWLWYERLWSDVCELRTRYHLPVRSGWWRNELQVEALAAIAAWVDRYDSSEWDDPPGKLALLHHVERTAELLRDGTEPFHPDRDRFDVRAPPGRDRLPAATPGDRARRALTRTLREGETCDKHSRHPATH